VHGEAADRPTPVMKKVTEASATQARECRRLQAGALSRKMWRDEVKRGVMRSIAVLTKMAQMSWRKYPTKHVLPYNAMRASAGRRRRQVMLKIPELALIKRRRHVARSVVRNGPRRQVITGR